MLSQHVLDKQSKYHFAIRWTRNEHPSPFTFSKKGEIVYNSYTDCARNAFRVANGIVAANQWDYNNYWWDFEVINVQSEEVIPKNILR